MSSLTIPEYLKYIDLQAAAEAFLKEEATGLIKTGAPLLDALIDGNTHSTKFTTSRVDDFLDPITG